MVPCINVYVVYAQTNWLQVFCQNFEFKVRLKRLNTFIASVTYMFDPVFQHMEKLKAENAKIKEENRALTRVVAKLSK